MTQGIQAKYTFQGEVFVIDVELDHKKNRPATKSGKAWGRAFTKAIQQAPALPETIVEKEPDVSITIFQNLVT